MDQDDPEMRFPDLEWQLAEQKRDPDMSAVGPDHAEPHSGSVPGPAARRLLAHARPSNKQVNIVGSGLSAALLMLFAVVIALGQRFPILFVPWIAPWMIVLPALLVATAAYLARRRLARQIVICVTSDGLTINQRPEVFSFSDAELGVWNAKASGGSSKTEGTALHLQCGSHRFVLGGEDHRVMPETRLDAPPTRSVDATISASDFEELLALVGSARGG